MPAAGDATGVPKRRDHGRCSNAELFSAAEPAHRGRDNGAHATDHIAAAAYLMKHAGATALVVLDAETDRPVGIVTDTDVAHAVADGKNVNEVRISEVMTPDPTVVGTACSLREAAELMTNGHFRHLPVVGDSGLAGIVDISTISRALLGPDDR
jgi:signal-transduction protein with cAMP-binding, CBS, and nucleotidyltransferase domain